MYIHRPTIVQPTHGRIVQNVPRNRDAVIQGAGVIATKAAVNLQKSRRLLPAIRQTFRQAVTCKPDLRVIAFRSAHTFYRVPFHLRWASLAGIVFIGILSGYSLYNSSLYRVNPAELKLLGKVGITPKFITESDSGYAYSATKDEDLGNGKRRMTLAASAMDATGDKPYEATLPKQPGDPIKFGAGEDTPGFSLTPLFDTGDARTSDDEGRVLYAKGSNELHAYTFKKNGIKQDIIVRSHIADELSYSWKLNLGKDLEAKLTDGGGVGIYGADEGLLANATAGSESDQALLDKAKQNASKTKLLYVIPAPFIVDAAGQKDYKNAEFTLDEDKGTLTLTAKDLDTKQYPISIDPTVTVDTTAHFMLGNDDGMIRYATADDGEIERNTITGGDVGTESAVETGFETLGGMGTVIYNGYLYMVGGYDGAASENDIQSCLINTSTGSIGTCNRDADMYTVIGSSNVAAHAYNGRLYIMHDSDASVNVCALNTSTGRATSCSAQSNVQSEARYFYVSGIYNGYLYMMGGYAADDDAMLRDARYCKINGSTGALESCADQSDRLPSSRVAYSGYTIYNGYIYVVGGYGSIGTDEIIRCAINADASVSTCVTQTAAFTTARVAAAVTAYKGYLYITGGRANSSTGNCTAIGNDCNDIQYCPIYASGEVGTCTLGATVTTARISHGAVAYNGYVYIVNGAPNGVELNNIRRFRVPHGPPGSVDTLTETSNTFTTGRMGAAVSVLNGYIYIMGGLDGSSVRSNLIDACTINASTGAISSCTQSGTTLPTARSEGTGAAYNGYIYMVGGSASFGVGSRSIQRCPVSGTTVSACTETTSLSQLGSELYTMVGAAFYVSGSTGYLIVSGGVDPSDGNYYRSMQTCTIGGSGAPTCGSASTHLTHSRYAHGAFVYGNYYFTVGGSGTFNTGNCDSNSWCADAQSCPISSSGVVSACTQQTNVLANGRGYMGVTVYNGYLYIAGGVIGSSVKQNDVLYCPITGSTIGTCTQQTSAFTTARFYNAAVAYNGYLYVVAGSTNGSAVLNDVRSLALISSPNTFSGTLGIQVFLNDAFAGRTHSGLTVYNNFMYFVGGSNSGYQDDVQIAYMNRNGSLSCPAGLTCGGAGTFYLQDGAFTTARETKIAAYNGYLYLVGGQSGASTYQNDYQFARINNDGTLSCPGGSYTCSGGTVFHQVTSAFTTARTSHALSVWNGYLYITGGQAASSTGDCTVATHFSCKDYNYAAINSDGSLACPSGQSCTGSEKFKQVTGAFSVGIYLHTAEVYNGFIYIVGTSNATFTGEDFILRSSLNGNGSLSCPGGYTCTTGVFTSQASVIGFGAFDRGAAFANGYLYISGGYDGSGQYQVVQKCAVNSDGTVNVCSSTNYTTDYATSRMEYANGFIYTINNFPDGDIDYFPQNTVPANRAHYERVIDTGGTSPITIDSVSYTGSSKCGVEFNIAAADSSAAFGSGTSVGAYQPGATATPSTPISGRYARLILNADDSTCGTYTTINDITINYTARAQAPTLELPTAGQTGVAALPEFRLRALDTETNDLQYMVQVCSDATCNTVVRTICQANSSAAAPSWPACTGSQTGWTNQNVTSTHYTSHATVLASSQQARHTYQATALSYSTTYYWRGYTLDPSGSNGWSVPSAIQSFTTVTVPDAPTLISPVSGVGTTVLPTFSLRATDAGSNYLKYMIELCSDSNCNTILRTICQADYPVSGPTCTGSQTGWTGQDQQSGTAYTGSSTLANSTIAILALPSPNLDPAIGTYYWRARAIDPGDSNIWSSPSSTSSFIVGPKEVRILGGTNIRGGTRIAN